jgi:hypothetical protein
MGEPANSGPEQPAKKPQHAADAGNPPSPEATAARENPAPPAALTGWAEITNPNWKPSFTREQAGLALVFTGKCPSCIHDTMFSVPFARPDASAQTYRNIPAATFTMYCECGYPHPGHPDGDNSCGAYWPYEAEL